MTAWQTKLDEAVALRRDLLRLDDVTDAYRVIHAEADGLPGLVVDRLGDVLSAEVYTLGMYQRAEAILARLAAAAGHAPHAGAAQPAVPQPGRATSRRASPRRTCRRR